MTKLKKVAKLILIAIIEITIIFVLITPILIKQVAMSIYDYKFGIRFESNDPMAWNVSDFDNLIADKYTFESDEGQMLTGYKYYKKDMELKGLVVLAHGYSSGGQRTYMNVTDFFASNGYAVFAYDVTANNESEGEEMGGLPQGLIDLDYALRFVKYNPEFEKLPIVLWGHSLGGYSVGAVLKLHPDVKAVAMIAGFNESLDMLEVEGRRMVGPLISLAIPHLEKHQDKMFGQYASMTAMEGLAASDAFVLVAHSEDDNLVPIEKNYELFYEKYSKDERFTFVRFKNRGHGRVFCSESRTKYMQEYNRKFEEYKNNTKNVTEEMIMDFYKENYDKHKGMELDSELMLKTLEMYDKSVK